MKLPKLQKRTMPGVEIEPTDTSHNGDKSERRQQKRRHAKTATTKTATTVVKTVTVHKSKRRRSLVKTATTDGRNGDNQWSKRRH